LMCVCPAAFAQDAKAVRPAPVAADTFEAGMAHLAAKAAFSPQPPPTREELLGVLLFISLRNGRGA
jgi:hypothetical protein